LFDCYSKKEVTAFFEYHNIYDLSKRIQMLHQFTKITRVHDTSELPFIAQYEYEYELIIFLAGFWRDML